MNYQFTVQFSEEHIKYACGKYYARFVGFVFPVVCLLVAAFAVIRMVSGKADLFAGILLAVAVIGLGIIVAAYFQSRNYRLSQFRKTGNSVSYELSEEFFKAKSQMGSTEMKWKSFKAIWIFQKVWLLVFDKNGYLTLPVDQISNEVKEFLKRKIISVGGKVK
ncbi:MAG TPA: YcxB family protein [Verrucomicrobiae bacterium]|nr:YcxB family protein [Verrucomicrobiae bacterium]